VERSQKHLLRLINDVLNLARIESGRVEYVLEDVDLAALMADVTPMVEPQMVAKTLTLEVGVADGSVARADREKVQQIVINLLSNALKFTPAGGRVRVAAGSGHDGGTVSLSVSDTGIGIAEDKQASVFDPFVQVDMSRTRRSEGSGLGLAISRDLARGMGGDLRVHSVPGEGSTFTLILPAEDGDPGLPS
jgi:signal transduction histidine kinase